MRGHTLFVFALYPHGRLNFQYFRISVFAAVSAPTGCTSKCQSYPDPSILAWAEMVGASGANPAAFLCCSLILLAAVPGPRSAVRATSSEGDPDREIEEKPLVFLAVVARNQEYTLRNFLGYIERLDYPKDRIAVW